MPAATKPSGPKGRKPDPAKAPEPLTDHLPVARVAVDLPLAHLDRPFDYAVPESLAENAVPGARVRVRVAGQQLDGFVLDRLPVSEFGGKLQRLVKVFSAEPVLSPEIAELTARVAARYAGTHADVLRLAIPPRAAKVEKEPVGLTADPPDPPDVQRWVEYDGGADFIRSLSGGERPRAVWNALPDRDWAAAIATAVHATLASGRGALVVVPDRRDVDRVDAALLAAVGADRHVALTADLGPTVRYRRWLALRRGQVSAVVGTRAAAFAPVRKLGLVVIWDDGDDLHAEPRAPYPHVREVLALRAQQSGAAFLLGGHARTAEGQQAVATGWARSLEAPRTVVRAATPLLKVTGDDAELARDSAAASARLPSSAWQVASDALRSGPVLIQVPRSGYIPGLACADCRTPARCQSCAGPLRAAGGGGRPSEWPESQLACGWCGVVQDQWRCSECGRRRLRAVTVGVRRTAEELGRAFPGAPVVLSAGENVVAQVGDEPALVLATPGGEPIAEGGYRAALLLDSALLLTRPDLRAGEEALRRWMNAVALVRPAADGGRVVLVGHSESPTVQALVRWDPTGHAERELAERSDLRFPPMARWATVEGSPEAVDAVLAGVAREVAVDQLGPPAPLEAGRVRAILRTPRSSTAALTAALRTAQAARTAAKLDGVRVSVDPTVLG